MIEANGGEVVFEEYYPLDQPEFGATVNQILDGKVDCVFNTVIPPGLQPFMKQLYEAGFQKNGGGLACVYYDENLLNINRRRRWRGLQLPRLLPGDRRSVQRQAAGRLQQEVPRHQVPVHRGQRGDRHVSRPQVLRGRGQGDHGELAREAVAAAMDKAKIEQGPGGGGDGAGQDALQDEHVHRAVAKGGKIRRSSRAATRWSIPRNAEPTERERRQAAARLRSGCADNLMTETTPTTTLPLPARPGPRRWQSCRSWKSCVLAMVVLLPLVLKDYLMISRHQRADPVAARASASICAGAIRHHELRPGAVLRRRGLVVALVAPRPRLQPSLGVLPAGHAGRACHCASARGFPAARTQADQLIFVALGTLTGSYAAERLAPAGSMSAPATAFLGQAAAARQLRDRRRAGYLLPGALPAVLVYLAVPLPGALAVRPGAGRHAPERGAARLLRLQGAALQGAGVLVRRHDRGPWRALYAYHEGFIGPTVGLGMSTTRCSTAVRRLRAR